MGNNMALKAKIVEMLELSGEKGVIGTFRVVSEWEGFKKLECIDNGEQIIVAPKANGPMENTFNSLFGEIFNVPQLKDMIAIAASPEMTLELQQKTGMTK